MRSEDREDTAESTTAPTYKNLLRAVNGDQADRWGWTWMELRENLVPTIRKKR